MPPPGNNGAASRKDLRVLLPFTNDSLRIPDELAAELGSGTREALLIGPSGGEFKVWRVEVRRDGGGALLGRGWPEFAAACGAGRGWFLVLRHRGRGVLTVKAFDASRCRGELGAPAPPEDEATTNRKEAPSKLQFISTLSQDSMEKMLIPAKCVQLCIPKENLNNMAVVLGPLGKTCQIELEINRLGMFFAYGWSQFLLFHGITGANALLLRYEGNMVFTVKVFEPNGCLRAPKHEDIKMQQGEQNIN
ncbi:hypothetical protein PR202_gb27521 [Eleusine coracana subsp. coracana]|uniref:TF-B3 domain-containing protein n=1 Tax=Eleusine coracana subsp. coracana TaxID=191504 RepID=A0AAV5FU23_ELECO|nr:hypothetical protein PR202_gb27521 [Eleusine coracana subsp. coracana]